jgi:murein DD-endopeptidase MepM/ murein hydrolase activator NlpD
MGSSDGGMQLLLIRILAIAFAAAALVAMPAQASNGTGGTAPPSSSKPPKHRSPTPPSTGAHRLPISGPFSYGDGFGVDRPGHMHQGIDLLAPKGTPILAPRSGTVTKVAYQAGGAGYYVVLSGTGEVYDYVFMHMIKGSVLVTQGETVKIGQQIGNLGSTGASSGPHLHFEIWDGPWAAKGKPVDPRPFLNKWSKSTT